MLFKNEPELKGCIREYPWKYNLLVILLEISVSSHMGVHSWFDMLQLSKQCDQSLD